MVAGLCLAWAAASCHAQDDFQQCLLQKLATAPDATPVGDIRSECAAGAAPAPVVSGPDVPMITQRRQDEAEAYANRYAITAHRPNYLLLASYAQHRPSNAPFVRDGESTELAKKVEAKFQISLKAPLWLGAFGGAGDIFAGYTQRSFWQMYNTSASAPFRENDYEPEVWFRRVVNQPVLGWNVSALSLGFNHQSNGRGHAFSHSWNRIIGTVALERGNIGLILRPWWRIHEDRSGDDNPDITRYLGNFDLTLVARDGEQSFELMLRNNLHRHDNLGAIQLGWSFPLTPRLRGYLQWFYGYGESLIDYNVRQNTIGAGILLVDW